MFNPEQIEKEITNDRLRPIKVITFAMNLSVFIFAVVCFVLYERGSNVSNDDTELTNILLITLFFIISASYSASAFIPKRILINHLKQPNPNLISIFNSYQILKLAFYEAPALFGLVIIILGITDKSIYANDYSFIAIAPMIAMLTFSILNFPSEYKVKTLFKEVFEKMI